MDTNATTDEPRWVPSLPLLVGGLVVLLTGLVLLELLYSFAVVPPGVDPGHWITSGYGYVGKQVPPAIATGSPYLYPPLAPALIGVLYELTGSPVSTALVAGALLFTLFVLSCGLIAQRFLRFPPAQVGFVGAAAFCGTTLSMLFWGAYPNFLGFFFLGLTFVFTLELLRRPRVSVAFLLPATVAVLYLTHTLVFAVAIASVGAVGFLILLTDGPRFLWTRIRNWGFVAGSVLLVGVVGGYSLALRAAHIVPPAYVGGNPAAYALDNVGQLFNPLGTAPAFFPAGDVVDLGPTAVAGLLLAAAGLLVLLYLLFRRWRPSWIDHRFAVAIGALGAALALPAVGWLAHVSTDYSRFLYFIPTPALLLFVLAGERVILSRTESPVAPSPAPQGIPRRHVYSRRALGLGYAGVAVLLVLLLVNVTIPMALYQEQIDTGPAHSADFLSAAQWLAQDPTPGNVLTLQSSARWTEALTSRGAFDIGPTWLDFEAWQIVDAQEAYWALNSAYAVTDNAGVLSYTTPASPVLNQAPMYSIYSLGVPVPLLRLLLGGSSVSALQSNTTVVFPESAWGPETLLVNPANGNSSILFSNPAFNVSLSGALGQGSAAFVNLSVTGRNGTLVQSISLAIGSPPANVPLLGVGAVAGVSTTPTGFQWNTSKTLGPLPTPTAFATTAAFTPSPATEVVSGGPVGVSVQALFEPTLPSSALSVALHLSTPGSSNPGITLPPVLTTNNFLAQNDIRFLLTPSNPQYASNVQLFESAFGFTIAYSDSSWEVLQR
ncbi:MAG: hypothetical protein L3K11_06045 [Thermoplasmata archaeon]|nr:hypothetical protein [Thermoplasmata archaeon]